MAQKFQFPTNMTGKNLMTEIYDAVGTAICVTDEHGNYVEVNKSYCDLYGYAKEELVGNSFTIVLPKEMHEIGLQIHAAFIAGAPEMPGEWQVLRRDGKQLDIYVQASLLIREDGMRCKVTAVTDITEYKKMKGWLRTAAEQNAESVKA